MSEHCELPAALKKCLSLWHCAKTDSERLAVLLLVRTAWAIFIHVYTCMHVWPTWRFRKTYMRGALHSCTCVLRMWLQVTKVVRNEEVCAAARRQIFDTVGFTFINRLLASGCHACAKLKSVPESMNVLRVWLYHCVFFREWGWGAKLPPSCNSNFVMLLHRHWVGMKCS